MSQYDADFLAHLAEHWLSEARWARFNDVLDQRTRYLTVVMDNLYQLQNASAVMRSCEAMGVQDVHLITRTDDLKHERGIAMGSSYWLSVRRHEGEASNRKAVKHLKDQGYQLVATSPHAEGVSLEELVIDQPTALLFGEEKPGLSDELLEAADVHLRIPMAGFAESYNVSVSVALCLYELLPKLRASDLPWQLEADERQALALAWARRSVQHIESVEQRFRALRDD
jgi:tRNA (guanosine-2'-O-)-methyltransferase